MIKKTSQDAQYLCPKIPSMIHPLALHNICTHTYPPRAQGCPTVGCLGPRPAPFSLRSSCLFLPGARACRARPLPSASLPPGGPAPAARPPGPAPPPGLRGSHGPAWPPSSAPQTRSAPWRGPSQPPGGTPVGANS
eukprot:scaffold393445_cov17-Prasinocladus_malaysianus.AAC.1